MEFSGFSIRVTPDERLIFQQGHPAKKSLEMES